MPMQTVTGQAVRIETGPLKFPDDWPGVFIRGDEALGYSAKLRVLFAGAEKRAAELSEDDIAAWVRVEELAALLESCRAPAKVLELTWSARASRKGQLQ